MNNNNIYNTNNFIGTIHQDYFKTASNLLSKEIYNVSNILENHSSNYTNIRSNALEIISSNYTNNLRQELWEVNPNNLLCLIKSKKDLNNSNHTYIHNLNYEGEIRFKVVDNINNPLYSGDHTVRINKNGKLELYHIFDPLIPTYMSGWYDVDYNLIKTLFNVDTLNIQIIAAGSSIAFIEGQITNIYNLIALIQTGLGITNNSLEFTQDLLYNSEILTDQNWNIMRYRENYLEFAEDYASITGNTVKLSSRIIQETSTAVGNYGTVLQAGGVIAGIVGGIYSLIENQKNLNIASNLSNLNFQMTNNQRKSLVDNNLSNSIIIANDMSISLSNSHILQGFINSNVSNQQFIPSLKTDSLYLNSGSITGISTINTNAILTSTLATVNTGNIAPPSVGNFGGLGDKIIFSNGTPTTYPYSIGLDTKTIWMSSPSNINFYNNGSNSITITSNNELWCSGKIKENNIYLSNIYTTSNIAKSLILYDTPNVNKKFGFICQVNNLIYPNGGDIPYYKYDIYLPSYTISKIVPYTSDPYRIFKITAYYATCYFGIIKNGLPNIISYEIYMSEKALAAAPFGDAGINICAIGQPENYKLDKLMPNNLFLFKSLTANYNYLTLISTNISDVSVLIEDMLN